MLGLSGAPAHAQLVTGAGDEPVQVTADAVEFDQDLSVFTASGNVRIEQPGLLLTADWMAFHQGTRHALASGNVVVTDADDVLYTDFLQFNLDSLQGVAYQGVLRSATGFALDGSEVRKTSDETYEFKDPVFTTCDCPDDAKRKPWTIHAREANLEVGGYAVTKNTTIKVFGVPVLWTPRAVIPVKSDRQSGLLFPAFSNTARRGTEIGAPFFWAAHDQVGVTVTPYWTSDRGVYVTLDGEYLIGSEGSRDFGTLGALILPNDKEVEDNPLGNPLDTFRWGVRFRHQQRDSMPWGVTAKAYVNWASDNNVPFDFRLLEEFRRDRFMQSNVSLSKPWDEFSSLGAFGAVRWADDLQAPEDQDRDDFLLHRLPDIGVSQALSPLPFAERLLTSFDVRYTNFSYLEDPRESRPTGVPVGDRFLDTGIEALPDGLERNDAGLVVTLDGGVVNPDGTLTTREELIALAEEGLEEGEVLSEEDLLAIAEFTNPDAHMDNSPLGAEIDGVFQEGEPLLDKGHRIIMNPRIAVPFRVFDSVEVYPELGYHGTFYQTKLQGSAHRSMVTGRLDIRTRMQKMIDVPWIGGVDHLIEPRATFYGIGNLSGDETNPLFVPRPLVSQQRIRQLDLDNILRDPSDRIPTTHGIVLGVSQRFYSAEVDPDDEEVFSRARAEVLPTEDEDGWVASRMLADITTSFEYRTSDFQFGWFVIDAALYPIDGARLTLDFGWDLEEFEMAEAKIEASYGFIGGHQIGVRYRFLRDIPQFFEDFQRLLPSDERFDEFDSSFTQVNQIDLFTRLVLTSQISLTFSFRYSLQSALVLTNVLGAEYVSKCRCWALQVSAANSRDGGLDFRARVRLLGLGDERATSDNRGIF